jgi:hypothetical protein
VGKDGIEQARYVNMTHRVQNHWQSDYLNEVKDQ